MPSTLSLAGQPLRILLVAHNLGEQARAGTETYCLKLGLALAEAGAQVSFLAPQGPPAKGPEVPISWRQGRLAGLPFFQFARINQDFSANLAHPGFEAAFREILARHPVDLVHFHHTFLTSISLLEVALEAGLPVVLTLHDAWHLCPRLHCLGPHGPCTGPESVKKCVDCLSPWLNPDTQETRRAFTRFLEKRRTYIQGLLPRLRVLAPSRFLRRLHYRHGFAPGDIIHLPLGLDELTPVTEAPPDSPPRFVFLGNLVPVKRADLAVAAFLPLAGQAVLELWGQGAPDQPQSLLQSLAACPHIRYRGPYRREDLPGILAGAAAVVIPSDFENCPLVVREALMLKVPVIASRVGGIPEIVRHGENGLLFPAGNADALRRQALRLIRRPQLAARLRQGIRPVKTMAEEARELADLYRSMTVGFGGRARLG